ncbi:MAG: hypothetical protein LBS88_10940, partial [Tannerellaceae bacterium]|nr:hypothetical protein [Tannerellaceae bacterium]
RIFELCRYVSEISRRPIPEAKPVSGRWAVSHESGIHVRGTLADVLSFQAFDGKTVGRETMEICYGKHSGRAGQEKTFPLSHSGVPLPPIST